MKLSEIFKSMEEIKQYLEEIKPFLSEKHHETLKMVLGFGQEGITQYVEDVGYIDVSIVKIVKILNDTGYTTLSSCSGKMSEHPAWINHKKRGFIAFKNNDEYKKRKIQEIAGKLNLGFEDNKEIYLEPAYIVNIVGENDREIDALWEHFLELFLNKTKD